MGAFQKIAIFSDRHLFDQYILYYASSKQSSCGILLYKQLTPTTIIKIIIQPHPHFSYQPFFHFCIFSPWIRVRRHQKLLFCGMFPSLLLFLRESMGNCMGSKVKHLSTEYMQQIRCIRNHHLSQYLKDKSISFISCTSISPTVSQIIKSIFKTFCSSFIKMGSGASDSFISLITMGLSSFRRRSSFEAWVVLLAFSADL